MATEIVAGNLQVPASSDQSSLDETTPAALDERCLALIADACFEMFTVRELKKPPVILPELRAAFPEHCDREILQAVGMALSWKRLLKSAGRPVH